MSSGKYYFYIVSKSFSPRGGIYKYSVDSGGRFALSGFSHVPGCNWLEISPCGKVGYATGLIGGKGVIFTIPLADFGKPDCVPSIFPVNTDGCICHIAADRKLPRIYTANYVEGSFSILETDDGGIPVKLLRTVKHSGSGPNASRQEAAHVHQVNITPDGAFLAVTDLGADDVISYPLDTADGVDIAGAVSNKAVPPGNGPRHLIFSPDHTHAYLVNELSSTVSVLKYHNGHFSPLSEHSLLPGKELSGNTAAAVRLSEEKDALFMTNRGDDSIAYCTIDGGTLGEIKNISCGGESPRDGNFIAGGTYYLSANENSDYVSIFRYDRRSRELTPEGKTIELPCPQQIIPEIK